MKAIVIGGGVGGLTVALELAKKGWDIHVYEKNNELGGLASGFPTGGSYLERFYHHIFTTDTYYQRLVKEVGLEDKLIWINPKMGMFHAGRIWSFQPVDFMLKFSPLNLISRFRFALSVLYLQKVKNWKPYEGVTAISWLRKYAGRQVCEVVWEPLLKAKFGKDFDRISMAWMWARISTRAGSRREGKEALGYLKDGGFMSLINAAEAEIKKHGGMIQTRAEVQKIVVREGRAVGIMVDGSEDTADLVICTLAPSLMLRLLPDAPLGFARQYPPVGYLGALCLVIQIKESLSPIYWMNISDPTMPITAMVEHTNFMPPAQYQGNRYMYLGAYLPQDHRFFKMSADELLQELAPHVKKVFPKFDLTQVPEKWLFKELFAQPIMEINYSKKIPPIVTSIPNLYHISMAQVYPEDRGTNFSIKLGYELADRLLQTSR